MVIYRCDRCNKLIDIPSTILERQDSKCSAKTPYELCEVCLKAFILFIHGNAVVSLAENGR